MQLDKINDLSYIYFEFELVSSLRSSLFRFLLAEESESLGEVAHNFLVTSVPEPSRDPRLPDRKGKRLPRVVQLLPELYSVQLLLQLGFTSFVSMESIYIKMMRSLRKFDEKYRQRRQQIRIAQHSKRAGLCLQYDSLVIHRSHMTSGRQ